MMRNSTNCLASLTSKLILFVALLAQCAGVYGQNASVPVLESKELWFDSITGKINSGIINGQINWDYYHNSIGHQYFKETKWMEGEIFYDGERYSNISMKYDVHKDIVIIKHFDDNQKVIHLELKEEEISQFNMMGHKFKRFEFDKEVKMAGDGFYEIMFEGSHFQLYAKRRKTSDNNLDGHVVRKEFEPDDRFYLRQGNNYTRIKKAKSFIKLFKPYKKEIKAFLKSMNIRKRNSDDRTLIQLSSFCDDLPSPQL